jgi:hypothetical protein
MPWIQLGLIPLAEIGTSREVLGALEFVDGLTPELRPGARVRVEPEGEIWAEVTGFQVRLGRATEMRAKALSLAALLREQPAPGSILTLIAPTAPAITTP